MSKSRPQLVLSSCLVVWLLGASHAPAQQAIPDLESQDADPAAAALESVERAGEALTRWQKSIEAGAPIRDEDLAKLKTHLQVVGGNAQWLLNHARRAHRAELNAEPPARSVGEQAQAWIDQMRALGEGAAAKRAAAVAQLRAALEGDNDDKKLAALQTLQQIGDVNYDKAAFRGLVFPLVRDGSGSMLVAACYALFNAERRPNDLLLIQEAWTRRSAALDNAMSHLLFMYSDGKIEGRSEEIVLELLDSPHADVRRETLRGLWGASVSDRLAARIVALADDEESHHDAIYFGLSTFKPKNEAVVDKLIETLTDPDWNNWDRALWGLGYGVPVELQPRVAKALTDLYVARSDAKTREKCRNLIRQYAGEAAAEALPK